MAVNKIKELNSQNILFVFFSLEKELVVRISCEKNGFKSAQRNGSYLFRWSFVTYDGNRFCGYVFQTVKRLQGSKYHFAWPLRKSVSSNFETIHVFCADRQSVRTNERVRTNGTSLRLERTSCSYEEAYGCGHHLHQFPWQQIQSCYNLVVRRNFDTLEI